MKKVFYLILAGVAIGILVAPRKGSETRRKILDNFGDLKNDAMDQVNDIVAQGKDMESDIKKDSRKIVNEW
jgi:gas vesicle protein